MTSKTKKWISLGALFVGVFSVMDGMARLSYNPGPFVLAAAFLLVPIFLGTISVRVVALVFCGLSIMMAVHHAKKKRHVEGVIRRVRENSANRVRTNDANTGAVRPN